MLWGIKQMIQKNLAKKMGAFCDTIPLVSTRRLVETVIGQLTVRFNIEKVRARKLWTFTNRIARKVLSPTVCVFINKLLGNQPLQFDLLRA
jgi:hypothetical protein